LKWGYFSKYAEYMTKQDNFKESQQDGWGEFVLLAIKTSYVAVIVKTVWKWYKDNEADRPEQKA
jgi:hypothetical protein